MVEVTGEQADSGSWTRDERVLVYLSQRRARYASITCTVDGRRLILFTHMTEQQENRERGKHRRFVLDSSHDRRGLVVLSRKSV